MNLDAGSVSVPYESLKRVTRERKYVIEAAEGVVAGVQAAAAEAAAGGGTAAPEAAAARLDQYVQQLQGLKRKVSARRQRLAAGCGELAFCVGPCTWPARHPSLPHPHCTPHPHTSAPHSWTLPAAASATSWHGAARAWHTCAIWERPRPPLRWSGTGAAWTVCWLTTCCVAGTTRRPPRWPPAPASRWAQWGAGPRGRLQPAGAMNPEPFRPLLNPCARPQALLLDSTCTLLDSSHTPPRSHWWSCTFLRGRSAWWRRCAATTAAPRWPGARSSARACAKPAPSWSSSCGCRSAQGGGGGEDGRRAQST